MIVATVKQQYQIITYGPTKGLQSVKGAYEFRPAEIWICTMNRAPNSTAMTRTAARQRLKFSKEDRFWKYYTRIFKDFFGKVEVCVSGVKQVREAQALKLKLRLKDTYCSTRTKNRKK